MGDKKRQKTFLLVLHVHIINSLEKWEIDRLELLINEGK